MAMKKETKNILAGCSAGIVAVVLTVFGVSQCSGKKAARTELDSVRTEIDNAKIRANNAEEALLDARDSLSYYMYQNEDLKDQIAIRDTALTEMAKNLENCGKGKKRTTPTKRTPRPTTPASKPGATTVVTVNTAPAKTQDTIPATVVTVATPDDKTPINANGVTIGENAHHNNVNINNGTVNNYYVPVDTVKKYAAASQTIVVTRRLVCVPQK